LPKTMAQGLPERLRMAFLIQAAIAALIILVGAGVAVQTAKHDVAASALREEAAYFWEQRAADPGRVPPDSAILHGYALSTGGSAAALPAALRPLQPGLHDLPDLLVLVEQRDDVRLYLTYPRSKIDRIAMRLVLAGLTKGIEHAARYDAGGCHPQFEAGPPLPGAKRYGLAGPLSIRALNPAYNGARFDKSLAGSAQLIIPRGEIRKEEAALLVSNGVVFRIVIAPEEKHPGAAHRRSRDGVEGPALQR
jgi:hypothetical protein